MEFLSVWIPASAADLETALAAGTLREDHFHDATSEVGATANAGLAVDIASFAIDGGLVLIGVGEDSGQLVPAPVALKGLRERVEQIAGSLVDPPIQVETRPLPLDDDPDRGYLVVVVPPSPDAPHAVDGVYRGRGDARNRGVPDIEMRRLRAEREGGRVQIGALLDEEVARDPTGRPPVGHLYVVAEPAPGRRDMLVPILGGDRHRRAIEWMRSSPSATNWKWAPDLARLSQVRPRANGLGISTHNMRVGRTMEPGADPESVLDVELREGGGVRLFCGRGAARLGRSSVASETPYIVEDLVWVLTWQTVELAGRLSAEAHYLGNWQFGVELAGIRGLMSCGAANIRLLREWEPYSAESYRESTLATAIEAGRDPSSVAHRLLDRLLRSLVDDTTSVPMFPGFS